MAAEHININSWQHRRVVFATGVMLLLILLIRTGWAAEDAYVSLRVVENSLSGYGLT